MTLSYVNMKPISSTVRPVAYIAGPYTGKNSAEIGQNINNAFTCNKWLWDNGYAAFCPHMNNANFEEHCPDVPYEAYLNFDLKILRSGVIDFLVLIDGYADSAGSLREFELCRDLKIPIFTWTTTEQVLKPLTVYGGV